MSGYLDTVEERLAEALPGKRVYTEEELHKLDRPERYGDLRVIDALQSVGILVKEVHRRHVEDGFLEEDDWDDDPEGYETLVRYVVAGPLMKLIEDLKASSDAQPYFISVYWNEGRAAAEALHEALQKASVHGFLMADLQSGDQYRDDILNALKASRTMFMIESPEYHTRSRCKVERDFAVAKGARIVRLLICPPNQLKDIPAWLNEEYNYDVVQDELGLRLGDKVLGLSLPKKTNDLKRRRRGAMELVGRMTATQVRHEATKLGVEDELYGNPSDLKSQFVGVVYVADTGADRFCREVDLKPQF